MKILLIDQHPVVREGCCQILSTTFPLLEIEFVNTGEEALEYIYQKIPQLVILDIYLSGISGLETCRRLLQKLPQLPILFFTAQNELPLVRHALNLGARGFIGKHCAPSILTQAVQRLLSGHLYIEQALATKLAYFGKTLSTKSNELSPREFEVFIMLAKGLPSKEIAENLSISTKTVANYCTQIKHKLQVTNHIGLMHLALEFGIIPHPNAL